MFIYYLSTILFLILIHCRNIVSHSNKKSQVYNSTNLHSFYFCFNQFSYAELTYTTSQVNKTYNFVKTQLSFLHTKIFSVHILSLSITGNTMSVIDCNATPSDESWFVVVTFPHSIHPLPGAKRYARDLSRERGRRMPSGAVVKAQSSAELCWVQSPIFSYSCELPNSRYFASTKKQPRKCRSC